MNRKVDSINKNALEENKGVSFMHLYSNWTDQWVEPSIDSEEVDTVNFLYDLIYFLPFNFSGSKSWFVYCWYPLP